MKRNIPVSKRDSMGAPAKSFRIAMRALIIKERLGTSDHETVARIRDNPYLQYPLGARSPHSPIREQALLDRRSLVPIRG